MIIIKKLSLILILFLMHTHFVVAMEIQEAQPNYNHFLELCAYGNFYEMTKCIKENPTFDINHQDDTGTTALLVAAHKGHITDTPWNEVWYLLAAGANKATKNIHGQSLFSMGTYSKRTNKNKLPLLLPFYNLEEINTECKTISLNRYAIPNRDPFNLSYSPCYKISEHVTDVLEGKKDLESRDDKNKTALFSACQDFHAPFIIQLLKRGARLTLDSKSKIPQYPTAYGALENNFFYHNRNIFFALREAFNNGPAIPTTLICAVEIVNSDVAKIIRQLYLQLLIETPLTDNERNSPEAQLWKHAYTLLNREGAQHWEPTVCNNLCKRQIIGQYTLLTSDNFLKYVLLLPKKEKTKLNIEFFLRDCDHAQK